MIDTRALAIYTSGVLRAVAAYASDQAVAAGHCSVCLWRARGSNARRCGSCTHFGLREVTR